MLASGSKGNCVVLEGSSSTVLIDCGLSAKEVLLRMERAGIDVGRIDALLLTHEHVDHTRGVDVLCRKLDIPVHATAGTLADFLNFRRTCTKPLLHHTCRDGEPFCIGDLKIEPFATSHDAAEPCGFIISEGDLAFGYCTDPGIVTPHMHGLLRKCDGIVLESTHCPEMLQNGPYPEPKRAGPSGATSPTRQRAEQTLEKKKNHPAQSGEHHPGPPHPNPPPPHTNTQRAPPPPHPPPPPPPPKNTPAR